MIPNPQERPTIDVPWAASLLGCSSWAAYDAIKRGDFPAPICRIGRKIVVPTKPLLDLLGLSVDAPAQTLWSVS